jgi:aminocarboxymuconate-semialdehyde decarboxylase
MTDSDPAALGIDIHHHLLVPSYVAAAERQGAEDPQWAATRTLLTRFRPEGPPRSLEGRLDEMTDAGIGMSLLSVPAVVFASKSIAIDAARQSNEELVEAAASDPEHFRVLATLPLPWDDACVAEFGALAGNPMVVGILMPSITAKWSLDEERFRPMWTAIHDAGLPTLLHPSLEPWPDGMRRWRLGPGIGVPVETSVAALHLILSGVLDELPDLDVVVPQLGGVLPYLLQRLVDRGQGDAKHDVAHYVRGRLYYDNNSYHQPALQCAIDTVGAHRIMLGSDYPFRGTLAECVGDIDTVDVSPDDRYAMLRGTAESIFRSLPQLPQG